MDSRIISSESFRTTLLRPSLLQSREMTRMKNRILKETMTCDFIHQPGDLFRKNDSAVNGFAMSGITESWTTESFIQSFLR
jgi:hypothetical protein